MGRLRTGSHGGRKQRHRSGLINGRKSKINLSECKLDPYDQVYDQDVDSCAKIQKTSDARVKTVKVSEDHKITFPELETIRQVFECMSSDSPV